MKSLFGKVEVILIGLAIFSYAEVWGEDWCYYATADIGHFYYDKESITSPSNDILRVWERIIKDEDLKRVLEEKKGAMQKFLSEKTSEKKNISKEEFEKLYAEWTKEFFKYLIITEKRMLIEMKCRDKMFRVISGLEYDEKGSVMNSFSNSKTDWQYLVPETPSQELYQILCPQKIK
jgi:hypothetical protein